MIDNAKWDKELEEFINKAPIPSEPVIPEELHFPFMMIFYRKKISLRNQNYLMAVPIFSLKEVLVMHLRWQAVYLNGLIDEEELCTNLEIFRTKRIVMV